MGSVLAAANQKIYDRDAEIEKLETKLAAALTEKPESEQKSATARDLPDVYDVLNRVKAEDSKSKLTPGDIKRIYRILEES
ncbi:hypothetical protein QUA03_27635 [Microcoleus sp. S36b_A4]|uniref:hypothetical protein n=1 Tax=Microcoleus sp. S36b_A4 TaxID=3055420 RepID=UPI002FD2A037